MPTFIPPDAKKLTDRVTRDTVIAVLEHYLICRPKGLSVRRAIW